MSKTRQSKVYWFLIYPVGLIIFVIISLAFIYSAKGYTVSLKDGEFIVEKTGMIIFQTRPSGATVYLDNKKTNKKTNSLLSTKIDKIQPGRHLIKMEKEGFFSWERWVNVKAEKVVWANYVFLFSKNPTIQGTQINNSVQDYLTSKDNRLTALVLGDTGEVVLLNNSSGEVNTLFNKERLIKENLSNVFFEEWADDRGAMIIRGEKNGIAGKFVININNGSITDINGKGLTKVAFEGNSSSEVVGLLEGTLYRLNIQNQNLQTLETKVMDFKSSGNKIYYVQDKEGMRVFKRMNRDGSAKEELFDSLPLATSYLIIPNRNDQDLVAIKTDQNSSLYLFKRDEAGQFSLSALSKKVSHFEWSKDESMMLYINDEGANVYYFDDEEGYQFKNEGYTNIQWYNGRHLLAEKGGKLFVMDYDGINQVELGDIEDGKKAIVSGDNHNIYYFEEGENITPLKVYKVQF